MTKLMKWQKEYFESLNKRKINQSIYIVKNQPNFGGFFIVSLI